MENVATRILPASSLPLVADPAMVRLYELVDRLAPVNIPVLITGETGCGKELIATAIHVRSGRAVKPLISVNCAALHEALAEGELFGHEKGAFSGAVATHVGLIEAASDSTLFLDEVGELSPSIQAKLLRVLEVHRLTRIGDTREREIDVRIVAATNRQLEADVSARRFRQDLYFRLSAATLHLPPLRQRPSEVPLLASLFLEDACRRRCRGSVQHAVELVVAERVDGLPGREPGRSRTPRYVARRSDADREGARDLAVAAVLLPFQSKNLSAQADPLRSEVSRPRAIVGPIYDAYFTHFNDAYNTGNAI